MRINIFAILLFLCFTSCKVGGFGRDTEKPLPSQPLPGTVGVLQSGKFVEAGVPELEDRIRLSFQKKPFTKRSLRAFNKKVLQQEQKLEIRDSLDVKPVYYKIEIADKVGLIAALNNAKNDGLKTFLEATRENLILTSVDIFFPSEVSAHIDQASEVYLVNNKQSSYSLELLNKDRSRNIIDFNEGTSFGYSFSAFCWALNKRNQPEIAAFWKKGRSCPGNTEKNPEKLKKDDLFEKL